MKSDCTDTSPSLFLSSLVDKIWVPLCKFLRVSCLSRGVPSVGGRAAAAESFCEAAGETVSRTEGAKEETHEENRHLEQEAERPVHVGEQDPTP